MNLLSQLPCACGSRRLVACGLLLWAAVAAGLRAAEPFAGVEWSHVAPFDVPRAGLIRTALPPGAQALARPGLEDLRLLDPQGREVPFAAVSAPFADPASERPVGPRRFQVQLEPGSTVITLETGLTNELDSITLQTATREFIKAVQVEGSADGRTWRTLATGLPVFRQSGATRLDLEFPPGVWAWLRCTVDDASSAPVGFTGALLRFNLAPAASVVLPAAIASRTDEGRVTRLQVALPASHLRLVALELEMPEPMFMRSVQVRARRVTERGTNEFPLGSGEIHRLAVDGLPRSTNLAVFVHRQVPVERVEVEIANGDNPPLAVTGVKARVRPVYLVFRAAEAGAYRVLVGHPTCPAPRYDVGGLLVSGWEGISESPVSFGAPSSNANHRAVAALPGVPEQAASLDVTKWLHRKPVRLKGGEVHGLELDAEALAFAQSDLSDLRLVRSGEQIPYLIDPTPATRGLVPVVEKADDPKSPKTSRWQWKLPQRRLPVTRLTCSSSTPLFQRHVTLSETIKDDRGFVTRRHLGSAVWEARPGQPGTNLVLELSSPPATDTLMLETDNGDNPAIQLERPEAVLRVPRLLFKLSGSTNDLWLFYGHPGAGAPRYDLQLVASQLGAAKWESATLGDAEDVKGDPWRDRLVRMGTGGPFFWAVLVLVAATLLWVIVRFLPKAEA